MTTIKSIMEDPTAVAVCVRGVQQLDGKVRMMSMDSRLVEGADGYLHDEYFWVPRSEWMDATAEQTAFLASRPISTITLVVEG